MKVPRKGRCLVIIVLMQKAQYLVVNINRSPSLAAAWHLIDLVEAEPERIIRSVTYDTYDCF